MMPKVSQHKVPNEAQPRPPLHALLPCTVALRLRCLQQVRTVCPGILIDRRAPQLTRC